MTQFFDSSGYYNHDQYYSPGRRASASSDWSLSPSASTPMTRESSRESAITTYSDVPLQNSGSEYVNYNSVWSPTLTDTSLWSPISDSGHDFTFPPTTYDSPPLPDARNYLTGGDWWEYYDFIADVEPNQQPYWKLKPEYQPTEYLPATRIAEDIGPAVPRSQTNEGVFVCLERGCARSFRRKADLERHYSQLHTSVEQKRKYPCDWKKCQRARDPFHRRDHQRDHYRDYHNEDLMRRGSSSREDEKWWSTRKVNLEWWRCTRCLGRVKVEEHGYNCPRCKTSCEQDRQYYRGQ